MPNGYYGPGPREDWERLESPLKKLDPALAAFASAYQLNLTRNSGNWPERSLSKVDDLHRQVQIWLADEARLTLNVSASAWQDRDHRRYWRCRILRTGVKWRALRRELESLLSTGLQMALSWTVEDLEPTYDGEALEGQGQNGPTQR
jgi:hypothetical protein